MNQHPGYPAGANAGPPGAFGAGPGGGYGQPPPRTPSGLFPSGPPSRPTYREPHPVTGAGVAAGAAATALWLLGFGLLGRDLAGYAWWTVTASVLAWVVALVLVRSGDRGVATGIAIVTGGGLSIAVAFAAARWASTGDWPLW